MFLAQEQVDSDEKVGAFEQIAAWSSSQNHTFKAGQQYSDWLFACGLKIYGQGYEILH